MLMDFRENCMKLTIKRTFLGMVLLLFCSTLFSTEFFFDGSVGSSSNLCLDEAEAILEPSPYYSQGRTTSYPGYIGQFVSRNEPDTTMVFTKNKLSRETEPNSKFCYLYQNDDGSYDERYYREIFFLVRFFGVKHNGDIDDPYKKNYPVLSSGDSVVIGKGAGQENAKVGEIGFDKMADSGIYDGKNQFVYAYQYDRILIEITVIRTDVASLKRGTYSSSVTVKLQNPRYTDLGFQDTIHLSGISNSSLISPWTYYFDVENSIPGSLHFSSFKNRNSQSEALTIGKLTYHSSISSAKVQIASDASGSRTDFHLFGLDTRANIPYNVVYTPIRGKGYETTISPTENTFISEEAGSFGPEEGHCMEGLIKIYVEPRLIPHSGSYRSTIYCILTQQ